MILLHRPGRLLLVLLLVALAWTVPAASTFAEGDDDPPVVSELVVTARLPGPAWWRVTRGASTVYVLGLPMGPTPRNLAWDQTVLRRRLAGAQVVIMPPTVSAGLRDIPALLRTRAQLRTRTPISQQLPPPLADRFAHAVVRLRRPASRYEGWDALIAGQMLRGDYMQQSGLNDFAVIQQVVGAARRARAPLRALNYRAVPLLHSAMDERSPETTRRCVETNLVEVETPVSRFRAAADAWAHGDVRGAIDLPRGANDCAELMLDGFLQRSNQETTAAIVAALARPGRSVALVPIRRLVTRGGVVERLRAAGYTVDDPTHTAD